MTKEEFTEVVRSKMTQNLKELNPIIQQMTELLAKSYEKGFWAGFEIGTQVEPRRGEE